MREKIVKCKSLIGVKCLEYITQEREETVYWVLRKRVAPHAD